MSEDISLFVGWGLMKNVIKQIVQSSKDKNMNKVTKEQYEFALARIEELLPLVDNNTPADDKNAVELSVMSDVVIAYEKEYYPIS